MAKSLLSQEEVQHSLDISEVGGDLIRWKLGEKPIYILQKDYSDGFVHYVPHGDGFVRVACEAGTEGQGWAPDDCRVCARVAEMYKEAKRDNDDALKESANKMKGTYEVNFLVAVGDMMVATKVVQKGKKKVKKKINKPDFSTGRVGILPLTRTQFQSFVGLRVDPECPQVTEPDDLVNRIFIMKKYKVEDDEYTKTAFIAAKRPTAPPKIEYSADDFDLDAQFETDPDVLANLDSILSGEDLEIDEVDEDEEIDDSDYAEDEEYDDEESEEEESDEGEDDDDEEFDEDFFDE